MIKEAKANGISEAGAQQLRKMLLQYRFVFRIKLGADPPANVLPLQVYLIDKPRSYRAPQRTYAPRQRHFIISTVQRLESITAIYKNPHSRWASPALAVIKPGSDELRFTVDLRGPNSQLQPIVSAMPHLESMLTSIEGSQVFSKLDMAHAYWQLPLSKDSQEILSIQTPLGVYSSNRMLQGSTDAGNHFQAVTQEISPHSMTTSYSGWTISYCMLTHSTTYWMCSKLFLKCVTTMGSKFTPRKQVHF